MLRSYSPENTLVQNLEILRGNEDPGQLLAVGMEVGGRAVHAYAITGNSESSRNRILANVDGIVFAQEIGEEKESGNPSLTNYPVMESRNGLHIVSNGCQTSDTLDHIASGGSFVDAMLLQEFKSDGPVYTSRITGFTDTFIRDGEPDIGISVIRKARVSSFAIRKFFTDISRDYENILQIPGVAHTVHTYDTNGNPPPPFSGAPFRIPAASTAEDMAALLWENLNPETRQAVAAKVFDFTDQEIFIINRPR